jgi:hypothetical protein
MSVGPSPKVAMPVSTVVSLYANAQRISFEMPTVERDLTGKNRVGMRSSRESNPTFVAEGDAKCGTITQIPRNRMSVGLQCTSTKILADFIVANLKMKWILFSRADPHLL